MWSCLCGASTHRHGLMGEFFENSSLRCFRRQAICHSQWQAIASDQAVACHLHHSHAQFLHQHSLTFLFQQNEPGKGASRAVRPPPINAALPSETQPPVSSKSHDSHDTKHSTTPANGNPEDLLKHLQRHKMKSVKKSVKKGRTTDCMSKIVGVQAGTAQVHAESDKVRVDAHKDVTKSNKTMSGVLEKLSDRIAELSKKLEAAVTLASVVSDKFHASNKELGILKVQMRFKGKASKEQLEELKMLKAQVDQNAALMDLAKKHKSLIHSAHGSQV